ncbi:MAG: WYL domain-containing protein [Lachnospiraceae bacterium]|nr:WYL domain-containing protein [Lachnospiraceae bacterium]
MYKYESNLSFFHMAMTVNVLKNCSSASSPITLGEIQNGFSVISKNFNGRSTTFEQNFKELVSVLESKTLTGLEANLRTTFLSTFHGTIRRYPKGTFPINSPYSNKRELYYFEPLLEMSDVEYLTGAVTTNPYLTEEEKAYLETRTKALTNENDMFTINILKPTKYSSEIEAALNAPKYYKSKKFISNKHVLKIAEELHTAIALKHKIKVTYGRYSFDSSRLDHLKLMPIDKEYILNPYALCWNNGFYYLICTNSKYDNVTHFRVDRILSMEIIKDERSPIPEELKPYIHIVNHKRFFNGLKYNTEHPLMSVHAKSNRIKCSFETSVLSIIVDYFGKDIRISKTKKSETDLNGNLLPVYKAEIENVEYSSALLFALQQNQIVHVTAPKKLVTEVKEALQKSISQI